MENIVSRLLDAKKAMMDRLKRRGWKWWAIAAAILFAVEEAARALVSDSTANALVWLGKGVWWLAQQPVGYAGLFLVGYVLVLLGLSWWETRPKEPPPKRVPRPLSTEEKEIVHRIRVLWNRYGEGTVNSLLRLYWAAVGALPPTAYWSNLLKPKHAALERARNDLSQALIEDKRKTPQEVIEEFNKLYTVYFQACAWLARIKHHEDFSLDEIESDLFGWWKYQHCIFRDKLWDEHERAAFKGKFKISHMPFDQVVADFLAAAEKKPCENHKPTSSDPDSEEARDPESE
jgi:hypothetical protein